MVLFLWFDCAIQTIIQLVHWGNSSWQIQCEKPQQVIFTFSVLQVKDEIDIKDFRYMITQWRWGIDEKVYQIKMFLTKVHVWVFSAFQATWEGDATTPMIDMMAYRFYSPSNRYITLSTSTKNPKVNTYMLFHVKTSLYVPRIYYQVSTDT